MGGVGLLSSFGCCSQPEQAVGVRVGSLSHLGVGRVVPFNQVVPEASPALHMLDLLGVSRPMAYRHVFEDLRRQLEGR